MRVGHGGGGNGEMAGGGLRMMKGEGRTECNKN